MSDQTKPTSSFLSAIAAFAAVCWLSTSAAAQTAAKIERVKPGQFKALLSAEQVSESRLQTLKDAGIEAIALELRGGKMRAAEADACERIRQSKLALYYWVEVARCAELADAHPAWMASLQGHTEWRRLFKDPPVPADDEVVKTYPWVPVLNKEPFQGQLARVEKLLADRPHPKGVFLNDLQGAPSACGCGNHLCRWTSDYGKIRTSTPLDNDAPAAFVAAVKKLQPHSQVIPVWTTECEEHDGHNDGLCAGVGCFRGICWKAYTEQLTPLAKQCPTIGVLSPYRALERDLPIYGRPAGWIAAAIESFQTMPARYRAPPVLPARLIAVLQGWDVSEQQVARQIDVAMQAGAGGVLVSYTEIEQSWQPRAVKWK